MIGYFALMYILPRLALTVAILIALGMIVLSGLSNRLYERYSTHMMCIALALTVVGLVMI